MFGGMRRKLLYLQSFTTNGELAHLVERLHGMQEVTGSIPVFSTQCGQGFQLKTETLVFLWVQHRYNNWC